MSRPPGPIRTAEDIRAAFRQRREHLSPQSVRTGSGQLFELVRSCSWYLSVHSVALYASIRNEVDPILLAKDCLRRKVRVCYPRIEEASNTIGFCPIQALDELRPGAYGVNEPAAGAAVEITSLDLAFVPGLAFDTAGARIGFGKGYYDRTLARAPATLKVGLAWEWQVLPEGERLTTHPGDVAMDLIVTDERILTPARAPLSA